MEDADEAEAVEDAEAAEEDEAVDEIEEEERGTRGEGDGEEEQKNIKEEDKSTQEGVLGNTSSSCYGESTAVTAVAAAVSSSVRDNKVADVSHWGLVTFCSFNVKFRKNFRLELFRSTSMQLLTRFIIGEFSSSSALRVLMVLSCLF